MGNCIEHAPTGLFYLLEYFSWQLNTITQILKTFSQNFFVLLRLQQKTEDFMSFKILQDGPFLSFRLILIVHYRIVSYMNIFFTCKNTLVILLQLYRLYVVQTENRSKIKKKSEVSSISIISKEDMYKDVKSKRISEERRRKRRRDKDIEANYSDSEETTEEADKFDSSPRNIRHSRRFKIHK